MKIVMPACSGGIQPLPGPVADAIGEGDSGASGFLALLTLLIGELGELQKQPSCPIELAGENGDEPVTSSEEEEGLFPPEVAVEPGEEEPRPGGELIPSLLLIADRELVPPVVGLSAADGGLLPVDAPSFDSALVLPPEGEVVEPLEWQPAETLSGEPMELVAVEAEIGVAPTEREVAAVEPEGRLPEPGRTIAPPAEGETESEPDIKMPREVNGGEQIKEAASKGQPDEDAGRLPVGAYDRELEAFPLEAMELPGDTGTKLDVKAGETRPGGGLGGVDNEVNRSLLDQLQARISYLRESSEFPAEIRIKLNPPEMGEMLIRVVSRQGRLAAEIVTEVASVKEMLALSMGDLQQRLEQADLYLDRIDLFSDEEFTFGTGSFSGGGFQREQAGRPAVSQQEIPPPVRQALPDGHHGILNYWV